MGVGNFKDMKYMIIIREMLYGGTYYFILFIYSLSLSLFIYIYIYIYI